jgi:glucose/arabinose dehydrogenase
MATPLSAAAERNGALAPVARGLSFPTSLTFDAGGTAYVAEAGLPFGGARPGGRVWRLGADGRRDLLAENLGAPVNGLTHHDGDLYVTEGGHPGRITRIAADGTRTTVLDDLPGPGNYQANMVAFGPDGRLYFSVGAMTNAGIVGLDAYELGWLNRLPHAHDIPGHDIVLNGVNVDTPDPRDGAGRVVRTGAFAAFGTPTRRGQRVTAGLPCTAGVMRCRPDGGELELVAWGLRNAYGLGFLPDGRLLATDQGADDRGSRPIGDAPDALFEVRAGVWYGWPDFVCGEPVHDPAYRPTRGPAPAFVIADHEGLGAPARPLLRFPPHAAAVKFAVAPRGSAEWQGHVLVALFGDERPMTAPDGPRAGRAVVRVDPGDWSVHPFLDGALKRPIDVRFHPLDGSLHVLDFGDFEVGGDGMRAVAGSGALWRLDRTAFPARTPPRTRAGRRAT